MGMGMGIGYRVGLIGSCHIEEVGLIGSGIERRV
jgi:hypothetical protein